jgi:hypothetical protein
MIAAAVLPPEPMIIWQSPWMRNDCWLCCGFGYTDSLSPLWRMAKRQKKTEHQFQSKERIRAPRGGGEFLQRKNNEEL